MDSLIDGSLSLLALLSDYLIYLGRHLVHLWLSQEPLTSFSVGGGFCRFCIKYFFSSWVSYEWEAIISRPQPFCAEYAIIWKKNATEDVSALFLEFYSIECNCIVPFSTLIVILPELENIKRIFFGKLLKKVFNKAFH